MDENEYLSSESTQPSGSDGRSFDGVERLVEFDSVLVRQIFHPLSIFEGLGGSSNKFLVMSLNRKPILKIVQAPRTDSQKRSFNMKVFDLNNKIVAEIFHPRPRKTWYRPCGLQEIIASAPIGLLGGFVEEQCATSPEFKMYDSIGNFAYKIQGPRSLFWNKNSNATFQDYIYGKKYPESEKKRQLIFKESKESNQQVINLTLD